MNSMMTQYAHLSPTAQTHLALPDKDRIREIQTGTWLPLDHAKTTLQKLEELLDYPKVTRMPSYLIVGLSYSGKTSILERFRADHLPDMDPHKEVTRCPVVMVDAPPKPDLSDFYSRIMDSLMTPYKPTAPVYEKYSQVKRLFGEMDVRILIIDEIHHLIAGGLTKQREFRNALKSLSNEAKISIVASGIEEAYNAFNSDPQMSSRFVPIEMPSWTPGKQLGTLLMTLERRTPLRKPSGLHYPEMMQAIYVKSESTLGDIFDLVKAAAVEAVRSGEEAITEKLLADLDWVPPSKRKTYRRRL
ncbi:AAA family ATPase [Ralstonia insidiosa]|uniref:AAA family ATPase n=2 Tax=Ralstonia insidiosa TaxID=190721 RepID=A0A848P0Q5_9RALS|nr:AAA family ATPase [Ralstonia insidiosa]